MNEESLAYLINNRNKKSNTKELKEDLSEKEFIEIYHELLDVFLKHNLTYGCAVRVSVAWTNAILQGAVELYTESP